MTVLQQIRSYYQHLVPGNLTNTLNAKKLAERLLTAEGIKAHPTPEDYFAERGQRLEDGTVPATQGRLLSEQA